METNLMAALVKAQSEFTQPAKTATANMGSFSYSYAPLDAVLEHIKPVMTDNKLAIIQDVTGAPGEAGVTTVIVHESGEAYRAGTITMQVPADAQKIGSAITYLRRYSLTAALGLAPEDDDDGAGTKPGPKPKTEAKPKTDSAETARTRIGAEMKAFAKDRDLDVKTVGAEFKAHTQNLFNVTTDDATAKQLSNAWASYQKTYETPTDTENLIG